MDREEYEALKTRAEEEHQKNLAAIERVWAMAQANGIATATAVASVSSASQTTPASKRKRIARKGKALSEVRAAIKDITGVFDFSHVLKQIEANKPDVKIKRGTLKAALKNLSDKKEIEVVTQGIGRKPTTYRKK